MNYKGKKRIVVTGVGPICSAGIGKRQLWDNILNSKNNISEERVGIGSVKFDKNLIHKIPEFSVNRYDIDQNILDEIKIWKRGQDSRDLNIFAVAIKLAIDDSKLKITKSNRIGLVMCHENPGAEQFYFKILKVLYGLKSKPQGGRAKVDKSIFEIYDYLSRDAFELQTFMFLYHITRLFNIHGFALFVNNACASGLYSLEAAAQIIRTGKADVVVVAGVDSPGLFRCRWLKDAGLISKGGIMRPFDISRDGFICGEGGASLIIESYENAVRRGAFIYAEYLEGNFNAESWKVTLPKINDFYYSDCILKCLKENNISSEEVDLVNLHGVATIIGDHYEAKAVNRVFQKRNELALNAYKPYFGHTLGGCGLLESATLLLSISEGTITPTLNFNEADPDLRLKLVKKVVKKRIDIALKISTGFAGFNGAVIFKKVTR
jgi:3-oxoacyl-(acyl-carrier-protein) synthase